MKNRTSIERGKVPKGSMMSSSVSENCPQALAVFPSSQETTKVDPSPAMVIKVSSAAIYRTVNISPMKQFAMERLSQGSALRNLILSEPDLMSPEAYLAKTEIWMKLLRMEASQ